MSFEFVGNVWRLLSLSCLRVWLSLCTTFSVDTFSSWNCSGTSLFYCSSKFWVAVKLQLMFDCQLLSLWCCIDAETGWPVGQYWLIYFLLRGVGGGEWGRVCYITWPKAWHRLESKHLTETDNNNFNKTSVSRMRFPFSIASLCRPTNRIYDTGYSFR